MKRFPFYRQLDAMDCGPACLRMVAAHYGRQFSLQTLRDAAHISREGVSLRGIGAAAESIGFRTTAVKAPFEGEEAGLVDAPLPCIVHWQQRHFVVVYHLTRRHVWVADPAEGKFKLPRRVFENGWLQDGGRGVILLLEPGPDFGRRPGEGGFRPAGGIGALLPYLSPFRRQFLTLALGLLLASVFQLFLPFLTQAVVDVGIQNQDLPFISLVLLAQVLLFGGQTLVLLLQNWILLYVGSRINVGLLTDFLIKLMRLPLGFFDAKTAGDLLQRIGDQRRIEAFLTTSSLQIGFACVNLLAFSLVLLLYNGLLFAVFAAGSLLYAGWIALFLRKRKEVDYLAFQQLAEQQSTLIELVQGMQEIKLQGSERKRRWQWAHTQARLFRINRRALAILQYQDAGAEAINHLKNILLSFLAARAVVEGDMSLGMMMAAQFIVGQLNAPLLQMIQFVRAWQDARISLERLDEIRRLDDEEKPGAAPAVPAAGDLVLENVSFRYNALSADVLKNVSLVLPRGKVTAIVGASGSGKTTLLKLLLGFYSPQRGAVRLGDLPLETLDKSRWRATCGAVMQDGFIFSDTIAHNIAESDERPDLPRLLQAAEIANIREFIESLPLGYNTMVGARGNGISQGQRQRILIARAVYKNPEFIFLDEATNALDAPNEQRILQGLQTFFEGKTVVVVAHRLSTVQAADQIVVLDGGGVAETGTHAGLVAHKGVYWALVREQLGLSA